jgi:hypothetical protein
MTSVFQHLCTCSYTKCSSKTALVYDELMTKHMNLWSRSHPETQERITQMWAMLEERGDASGFQ